MKPALVLLASLFCFCTYLEAQPEVQRSHIEANVPAPEAFERLLRRDLSAYFSQSTGKPVSSVEITTLRTGPTQSGVAYPKYYFWVKVLCGPALCAEGAVRVAAVQRERFEVTHFLAKVSIAASPEEARGVFPAALIPRIHQLAGVSPR